MAQGQEKLNLPQALARNQADSDKRKRVFAIVGDARRDSRIWVNEVARVTLWHSLEREEVADVFEGAFGGIKCLFFVSYGFLDHCIMELQPPPLTEVKG
jgi:hypothetical protein